MKYISPILKKNGFKKIAKRTYSNKKCTVVINKKESYYAVTDEEGTVFSPTLEIYWLIGYLTWNDLIDKDYEK